MSKGKLLVVAAPSGAGKTTIVKYVLQNIPELVFSVSATTRKARNSEVDGKDYFFISENEFAKKIESNDFIEWEQFYGYYYGTMKSFVESNLEKGLSVLLEIDVKGALAIKEKYPDAELIYVEPPSFEELKRRLTARNTESAEDLKKRLERVEMELGYKNRFAHFILNDNLESAKDKAIKIVKKLINPEE